MPVRKPVCGFQDNAMDRNISELPLGNMKGGELDPRLDGSIGNEPSLASTDYYTNMPMWKKCKNIGGLKIHHARMKCQVESSQMQRVVISASETQEVPSPPPTKQRLNIHLAHSEYLKKRLNCPRPQTKRHDTILTRT